MKGVTKFFFLGSKSVCVSPAGRPLTEFSHVVRKHILEFQNLARFSADNTVFICATEDGGMFAHMLFNIQEEYTST